MLCSNHSDKCVGGKCVCGFEGWRGPYCERKGCPGYLTDCSGHGSCLSSSQKCICESGWSGKYVTGITQTKFIICKHMVIDCIKLIVVHTCKVTFFYI